MKNIVKCIVALCGIGLMFSMIGCNNTQQKPSIKDNSVRKVEEDVEDYSDADPQQLFKHIQAHFDLEQFTLGKKKLIALIKYYPELTDSLGLNELKGKFDAKLEEVKAKELAAAERERKLRMPNATKNMRSYKKGNLTYYVDKTSPEFDTKECFYAYFTKNKGGVLELRFKARYIDTKWLGIESYIITIDELDHDLKGEVVKSETKGKKVYKHELLDIAMRSPEDIQLLNSIAAGKDVVALYVGKNSYKKRVITEDQKLAIRNVVDAFLFMGGTNLEEYKASYTNALK